MKVYGIDPGPSKCGFAIVSECGELTGSVETTEDMLYLASRIWPTGMGPCVIAIEQVAPYGSGALSPDIIETCEVIGKLKWLCSQLGPDVHVLPIFRKDVKNHWTGKVSGPANVIRNALLAEYGQQGTKKEPGKLYGITSHAMDALGLALMVQEQLRGDSRMAKSICKAIRDWQSSETSKGLAIGNG